MCLVGLPKACSRKQWGVSILQQFPWRIGTEWRRSRHVPSVETRWDWLKDGPLFAALTACVNGRAVGIPELHGAATSETPWNATGKPYSFSKFCAASCSICSELCHFSLYFRVLSITLNPLCKDKTICDFWSNRLGSFCLCSSATVIENNSVHNV